MTYTIEVIDITKKNLEDEIRTLYKEAFNMKELPAEGHFFKNMNTKASSPSFFLAAIEDGVIIGCNGFIAIDFFIGDREYTCYQSCHTATHPKHQGRKVFANLINYAKEYLKAKGAGFIFGVPNDNSYPIFIKKLAFTETPQLVVRIPNIPIIKNLFFNRQSSSLVTQLAGKSLMVREEQVIALKQQENREPVEVIGINGSFGWGKIKRVKKFGINFTYFYIGGVYLKNPDDYKRIIKKIFSLFPVSYVQIVSSASNSSNLMLKKWKKAKMNGFIFFDLNAGVLQHINIMSGIVDVY